MNLNTIGFKKSNIKQKLNVYTNDSARKSLISDLMSINNQIINNNIGNDNINPAAQMRKELDKLKYEFLNMSQKYEEQLDKYEELEKKNEFLLSKYRDLNYQFQLKELNIRNSVLNTVTGDASPRIAKVLNALDLNK